MSDFKGHKLLVVCPRVPWPAKDGGALAMVNLIKCYADIGFSVDMVCFNTPKHFASTNHIEDLKSFTSVCNVYTVPVDTRIKPLQAIYNLLFQKKSYNLKRFFNSNVNAKIAGLLQLNSYKLIHVESLFATTFLLDLLPLIKAPIVLRTHNIEYQIWERLASTSSNCIKKAYLSLMAKRLKKEEIAIANLVRNFFHIADTDKKYFESVFPESNHFLIPYAMQFPEVQNELVMETKVAFIGSMEWAPNLYGLAWLVNEVWPIVLSKLPNASLHIAGKSLGNKFVSNSKLNVIVHGEVPHALEYLSKHKLLVVPLFAGSGIRVKILESISIGLPVVTTSIGVQGISLDETKGLFIGNDAATFASQIVYVLQNTDLVNRYAAKGKQSVLSTYEESAVSQTLIQAVNQLVNT